MRALVPTYTHFIYEIDYFILIAHVYIDLYKYMRNEAAHTKHIITLFIASMRKLTVPNI